MIYIFIIAFLFLIWNILNEVAVNQYMQTEDKKYLNQWHTYDAIFRVILFPLITIAVGDFNITTVKILLTIFILYRPLFNIGFNIWRVKVKKEKLTFAKIFYLSEYSKIDNLIIKFSEWLNKILNKIANKINKKIKINISYTIINLIICVIEITLSILLWQLNL